MTAGAHGGPAPDLYQLLGVPRQASREEIARAWRRCAQTEHPDHRPRDDGAAAGRFRAVAGAYRVLSDPARRAAYDRTLQRPPAASPTPAPATWAAEPPLRVGPVRVEGRYPAPAGGRDEDDLRLAILAELALRYLARERDRPW